MKHIKILGKTYSITLDKDLLDKEDACGRNWLHKQEIIIDARIKKENKEETLIHEILEGLKYQLKLDLKHDTLMRLSETLYTVLSDNNMKTEWFKDE